LTAWFENESFWKGCYPLLFPGESFRVAPEQIERVLARAGTASGKALDLCCGPGRHAVALSHRGFRVTAVDRSPYLIEKARELAAQTDAGIEFVVDDMRSFVRPSSFDLIVNLSNSFGYFDDRTDDLRVLKNIHESLRPGGCVVIEMMCKEWLAKTAVDYVSELPDGSIWLRRHKIVDDWTRQQNEWLVIRGESIQRFNFTLQIYSGRELKGLLLQTGFVRPTLYGDLDGRPFASNLNRLVAVARKE
jgi:SAM-dependent methyltransferase